MKVEELYSQDKDSQIGITFQREPFETRVDIFPEVSPLQTMSQESGEPVETALTSVQMEEALCRAVKYRGEDSEFQAIPLKRVDSGPTSHRLQGLEADCQGGDKELSRHEQLLNEIDSVDCDSAKCEVRKKKEGTLTRMREKLKSMRAERGEKVDRGEREREDDTRSATKSLSKIFHRVNPVGKASRESFSKVFHRIGDALQKKEEGDKEEAKDRVLEKTLKHKDQEPKL